MADIERIDIDLSQTDREILRELEHGRATPKYVANVVGISRPHAANRLKRLVEHDIVTKIDRGLYELGAEYHDAVDGPQVTEADEEHHEGIRADPLADIDFPQGRDRGECKGAVYAARDYIREHGPASMREIVTAVMPEHSVGYDVPELEPGERYRGAWWRKVVKPGLEALPSVEKPTPGGSNWSVIHDG